MFEVHLTKNLQDGEEVLTLVRRYGWSFLGSGVLAVLVLFSPFFFLFPLLRLGALGVIALLLLFCVGMLLVLRIFFLYYLNVLMITNVRLIDVDQRGFFTRVVSETTYTKIQDVSFTIKGILQTVLQYGSVHIQTAGTQANIEIRNVRHPAKVQQLIARLQAEATHTNTDDKLSAEELVRMVRRIQQSIGPEEFDKVVEQARRNPAEGRNNDSPQRKLNRRRR